MGLTLALSAACAEAAQWPILNPTFSRFAPNEYATYALTTANGYHTGMDLIGPGNPCAYDTQVVAGVDGTVAIVRPLAPCLTPPVGSCPGSGCPDEGLGNSVTVLGNDGVYYTYGHLDSIDASLQVGQPVAANTPIGIMGNSSYGVPRHGYCPGVPACGGGQDFRPHLHFEGKTAPFIGDGYSGVAPDLAEYRDALRQIYPIVPITPIVIRVLPSPLYVQGVPDYQGFSFPSGTNSASVSAGQRYVAYEQVGSWLHLYVPPVKTLPPELWIPSSLSSCTYGRCCSGGQCVVTDTAPLPVVRVVNPPADNGLIARTQPSMTAPQVARLWEGDLYVSIARQQPSLGDSCTGEWFQLQVPQPSGPVPVVWACSRTQSKQLLEVREPCDVNGQCESPGICQSGPGTCTPTGCVYPVSAGAACDDGQACTGNDTCDALGLCAGTPACTPSPTPTITQTFTRTFTRTRTPTATWTPTAPATATASGNTPTPASTATVTPTAASTDTATPTHTATPTTATVCTTFATGVCCDSRDGTNCRTPAAVCTSDAACAGHAPYSVCAGSPADDGSATSTQGSVYANLTFSSCSMSGLVTGVARNFAGGNYAIFDGLLQWDTSSLPDEAVLTSATLIQTVALASSANSRHYEGEWFNWGTCDATDWTATAANTAFSVPIASIIGNNTDNSFALNGAAANVNVAGRTYLRLHISGGQPTGLNRVNAALYEHTTLPGARLRVCYTEPSPTATPAASPTPTTEAPPTPSPASSSTPTETATPDPSPPSTPTATDTAAAEASPSPTATPGETATSGPSPSPTTTATETAAPSATVTPTATTAPTASASATPSATPTATPTATPVPVCTTFATGVCCDSADGTSCRTPAIVCTSDSACAGHAPYTFCAGAASEDGSATSTQGPVYANLVFNSCSMSGTITGVARNLAAGNYAIFDALLQWDTSSLPDDASVTGATLIQTVVLASSANGRNYEGEWFNWGTCDANDWTPIAANSAFSVPISTITGSNSDNSFALSGAGTNVNVTGRTYLRLHISGGQPTGLNRVNAALYEHATLPGPRLRVCYVQPPA